MKDLHDVERELPSQLEELANTVGIGRMTRSAVDQRVQDRARRRRLRRAVGCAITSGTLVLALAAALALQPDRSPDREVRAAGPVPTPALGGETPNPMGSTIPPDSTTTTTPESIAPTPELPGVTSRLADASQPTASDSGNATPRGTSTPSEAETVSNAPPPTSPPPPAPASAEPVTVTVTEAEGSTSHSLRPGDRLIVRLAGGTRAEFGEPESSNPGVLRKTAGSASADGGAQASFLAVASGQATVSYAASSKCSRATPPCLVPSDTIFIYVTVSG